MTRGDVHLSIIVIFAILTTSAIMGALRGEPGGDHYWRVGISANLDDATLQVPLVKGRRYSTLQECSRAALALDDRQKAEGKLFYCTEIYEGGSW